MSMVRTTPRPKKLRSSSSASTMPSTIATKTQPRVMTTEFSAVWRNVESRQMST